MRKPTYEGSSYGYSLKTVLVLITVLSIYLALARSYGFGRAMVCLFDLGLAASSFVFVMAAIHSLTEENFRIAMALLILALLILLGSICLGAIVFM